MVIGVIFVSLTLPKPIQDLGLSLPKLIILSHSVVLSGPK